ncbi:unnamed protein product [Anisakis simplex]|uniref:SH2 domain-containing protein n=1 Tax=Anisakis simplex TaxID=6269 RepID=A0A0M3KBE7_ANISI|nr:unnamed protein product [Anisakis simplex]
MRYNVVDNDGHTGWMLGGSLPAHKDTPDFQVPLRIVIQSYAFISGSLSQPAKYHGGKPLCNKWSSQFPLTLRVYQADSSSFILARICDDSGPDLLR